MERGPGPVRFFSILGERLDHPLPGLAAQLNMVTDPRPGNEVYTDVLDSCKKAGVLVLLYFKSSRACLVLTRRTELLDRHQAQISFPGGRQEEGETLEQTALRETGEELGIDTTGIRILGQLTPLYIPPTNYCIYPVVSWIKELPPIKPSPFEVAEVLEIPLEYLVDPETRHREIWNLHGRDVVVPFYVYEGHKIWGATAMVLSEFIEILKTLQG